MPSDDTHKPPPEADDTAPKSAPLRWLWKFDHGLDIVKGLSLVTVLSSLAVGYLQYLNAYQDKVGSQAKEDMAAATSTFTEISRAFSEVQALQQALYSDFTRAVRDRSDESDQALVTKNARLISERYENAQIALRENIDVLDAKGGSSISTGRATRIAMLPTSTMSMTIRCHHRFCATMPSTVPTSTIFRRSGTCMPRTTTTRPSSRLPTANIAQSPRNGALTTRPSREMRSHGSAPAPDDKDARARVPGTAPSTTS